MIRIILNNTENKIHKDIGFSILDGSDEYTFSSNRKQ